VEGRTATGAPRDHRRGSDRDRLDRRDRQLAIFAGAGGLGEILYNEGIQRGVFKTNIVFGSILAVGLAILFDGLLVLVQRYAAPWRKVRAL
jgi:ABC-type proline/glycine betaine transport system permease subunit